VRYALIVGHNTGSAKQLPLKFAEPDASKVARALLDVGGVDKNNLILLQGRPLAELDAAFERIKEAVRIERATPGRRILLFFYFSGHGESSALLLGGQRLSFSRLKQKLAELKCDVNLTLIDACYSGLAIAMKGGRPAPAFDVRLHDVSAKGSVFLVSSAPNEPSLESTKIGGSFFSHFLVSGLRGAADSSGDGQITLSELYRYTYDHTVQKSAETIHGPHHPMYEMNLAGQGELVLSALAQARATLFLPKALGHTLVTDLFRDQIVAEIKPGDARAVALAPGTYGVGIWVQGQRWGARIELAAGDSKELGWSDLRWLPPGADETRTRGVLSGPQTLPGEVVAEPSAPDSIEPARQLEIESDVEPVRENALIVYAGIDGITLGEMRFGPTLGVGYEFGENIAVGVTLEGWLASDNSAQSIALCGSFLIISRPMGIVRLLFGYQASLGYISVATANKESSHFIADLGTARLGLRIKVSEQSHLLLEAEAGMKMANIDLDDDPLSSSYTSPVIFGLGSTLGFSYNF
jgi:hypothetical protein